MEETPSRLLVTYFERAGTAITPAEAQYIWPDMVKATQATGEMWLTIIVLALLITLIIAAATWLLLIRANIETDDGRWWWAVGTSVAFGFVLLLAVTTIQDHIRAINAPEAHLVSDLVSKLKLRP